MRRRGTVREWESTHGWIEWPGGAVFVHFSDLVARGRDFRRLFVGDTVEFAVEDGPRGFHAVRVETIQSAEPGGVTEASCVR